MPARKLTAEAVRKMKPGQSRMEIADAHCPNLYLIVNPSGRKSWAVRYRFYGKPQKLTIGPYPVYQLTDAREAGDQIVREVARGEDPKLARQLPKQMRQRTPETFRQAVEEYYQRYQLAQRKAKTADEIRRTLLKEGGLRIEGRGDDRRERVTYPRWIDRPVRDISARLIRHRLEEIRDGTETEPPRPYLANRFHSYLKRFFDWAAEPGVDKVSASPMSGLRKPFEHEETRNRVFSRDELVAIWRACDHLPQVAAAFVRVALLTGKRKGALAAMKNFELRPGNIWVPGAEGDRRASNKRADVTVLPQLAVDVMRGLPIEHPPEDEENGGDDILNEYVFIGSKNGRPLDPGTWLQTQVQQLSGVDDFFFHGLRHTVETSLASLGVAPHIRDMMLDHSPKRGSGAIYDHYEYIPELRDGIERWARYIQDLLDTVPLADTPLPTAEAA